MEHTADITNQQFNFRIKHMHEPIKAELDIDSYTHNGTLAIILMRTQPFPEEMEDYLKYGDGEKFREFYGAITVNLESSERLQPNVQFIDENNLPGIGDWLEKNDIAHPTGMMSRSGWCLYPAYEFNIPQENLDEIISRRMEINPEQTEQVLKEGAYLELLDIKDELDRCMTLGELKESWLSMPDTVKERVNFPEKIFIDGAGSHTFKEWSLLRFTSQIPKGLPAYSLEEARAKLDSMKEKVYQEGCKQETFIIPNGERTRFGEVELNKVTTDFPTEHSNPFLIEERNESGRLTAEYIAIDTSYNDNMKSGPCLEHIDGRITAFTTYTADLSADESLSDARCTFSQKGSLIAVTEGKTGPSCGHIQQTDDYNKAVNFCRDSMHKDIDKIISKIETHGETQQQKSRGPRR